MAVYKRGRAWEVRIQVGGRPVRRSCGIGSTKADAQELEARIRRDIVAGKLGRAPQRTIADAFARWLEGEAKAHKDGRSDRQRIRMWLPFIEGRPLRDAVAVAAEASDKWIASGKSPATINRRIAVLRRVCRLAHSTWGWLDDDLSRRFVALPGETAREVYPTKAEVMRLIAHAGSKPMADAILLAAYTGLRQGELLRLQKSDVIGDCVVVRVSKSGKPRTVPVPKQAQAVLKRLPIPLTVNELSWAFRGVRTAAKLPHIRWHDLRHAYGSWLAQSGASATVIRDVMGHSNLSVTSRYLHTVPKHVRAAVRKLK